MNRDIKFRVWSNYYKMFVVKEHLMWSTNRNGISDLSGISILGEQDDCDDDVEFMQYTGCKDKNGKEIYEGDILTPTRYKNVTGAEWLDYKCKVVYFKSMFCFEINGGLIQRTSPLHKSLERGENSGNEFEVIGNIYETPDFIKSK